MVKAAISWSGGKDCTLALVFAREAGFDVVTFYTRIEADPARRLHALPEELLAAQVVRAGGVWKPVVVAEGGSYAEVFAAALEDLRASGHTHMVFGDIDLLAHREWIEPICARAGIAAVFPLWGMARAEVARQILARGIRAKIVCVDLARLPAAFCGMDYDADFLARLPAGVCPAGEDGEFHSFVLDAPGFSAPLMVRAEGQCEGRTFSGSPTLLQRLVLAEELGSDPNFSAAPSLPSRFVCGAACA